MKTSIFIVIGIFVFIGLVFFYNSNLSSPPIQTYLVGNVVMKGKTFSVEISDTDRLRTLGLSGHAQLKDDEGMFFIFPKSGIYGFWMKDMLFPIDIIWVDENFKIIHIEKSISPDTYPKVFLPESPSKYVLEVLAGETLKVDLKIGDKINFLQK
ncbi:MAG: DUF192 domain-containing protein [Minisyncoccia bacterium]